MAVVQVVGQGVQDPRLQPEGVLRGEPQVHGQLVRRGKGDEQGVLHQAVGVGPEGVQGQIPIPPVQGRGDGQGQAVGGEEVQQPAHGQLQAEGLVDGLRPLGGDAPHLGQLLGVLLDDGEDILPKDVQQPPGGGGADALDGPGGQVFQQSLLPHGHPPLHDLGLKLLPVGAVAGPLAVDGEALPGVHSRHGAHHGDLLPLVGGFEAQDGIAVLLVAVDHRGDGSVQEDQFRGRSIHGHLSFVGCTWPPLPGRRGGWGPAAAGPGPGPAPGGRGPRPPPGG